MNEYLFVLRMNDVEKKIDEMQGILTRIVSRISAEEELLDNADLMKKWKVSARTLASWRSNGLIGYVQVGGKIYYTPEDRRIFLNNNHVKLSNNA